MRVVSGMILHLLAIILHDCGVGAIRRFLFCAAGTNPIWDEVYCRRINSQTTLFRIIAATASSYTFGASFPDIRRHGWTRPESGSGHARWSQSGPLAHPCPQHPR